MPSSSVFDPASRQALNISNLFVGILIVSAVIFLLVTGLVVYIAIRYRARSGEGEPYQEFGRRKLEIFWTVAPAVLLVVILGFTINSIRQIESPGGDRMPDVTVIGHQWWWEVRYPSGVVTANEIHMPVGRQMRFQLEGFDVIHDFWVPQLGRKMDMIPGHVNQMWLEADSAGTYLGACAEYCGTQHAWMRIRVIAQSSADFDAWQRDQLQTPTIPATGEAAQGAQLFNQLTCTTCHVAQDVGPSLTHFGSRETIAAGVLPNTPENLAKWLADPQAVKPGNHMPDLLLSDGQIRALVAYLEALK